MKPVRKSKSIPAAIPSSALTAKAATGIIGFDGITGGGLPRGRTSLLSGGVGSGKTVFSMQFLVNGARQFGENGIFVAFEETPARIVANFASMGWNLMELQQDRLFFLDAQPQQDLIQSGSFDLGGMLAALTALVEESGAKRIVFDAIDILLALMPDAASMRREVYRLHDWLLRHQLTGLITAKSGEGVSSELGHSLGFMQFMVDCTVVLTHRVERGVSQRSLRVQKFRGSSFDEDEASFVIGENGFDVAIARKKPLNGSPRKSRKWRTN